MIKLKSLTATLAATALVSGIGIAYAQNSTDASNPGPGAPAAAATDSQYNSSNSAMGNSTTAAPADTTSSTAPADTSSATTSTDTTTSADLNSADPSMTERAPQADRN